MKGFSGFNSIFPLPFIRPSFRYIFCCSSLLDVYEQEPFVDEAFF